MKIELSQIKNPAFDGEFCYTHARAERKGDGEWVMTTQPLLLTGMDVFYGMELLHSPDGRNWTAPQKRATLTRRPHPEHPEWTQALCDATPIWHRASGKLLLIGHNAIYGPNNKLAPHPHRRSTLYAVYDESTRDFGEIQTVQMPDNVTYYASGSGSSQCLELAGGDLLVPISFEDEKAASDPWHSCSSVAVMRCGFDGKTVTVKQISNHLTTAVPRGLCEPSIAAHGGEYFLCLRNDETGFLSKSADGLHFSDPTPLVFDDGENVGNYNTQQHWVRGGGKLYLVYTRKNANNDHVFRHRAPLFIAELDPERLCLIRATEQIVVPERGARLGNFTCVSLDDTHGAVIAAEWMQSNKGKDWRYCMEFGSDNSIFVAHLTFD